MVGEAAADEKRSAGAFRNRFASSTGAPGTEDVVIWASKVNWLAVELQSKVSGSWNEQHASGERARLEGSAFE